jgi:hypothetical protein
MLRQACVAHYFAERKVLTVNTPCLECDHASKWVGVKNVNCAFVLPSVSVFARNIDGTGSAAVFKKKSVLCNVFHLSLHYSDK